MKSAYILSLLSLSLMYLYFPGENNDFIRLSHVTLCFTVIMFSSFIYKNECLEALRRLSTFTWYAQSVYPDISKIKT